jgi:hypothetical protein
LSLHQLILDSALPQHRNPEISLLPLRVAMFLRLSALSMLVEF